MTQQASRGMAAWHPEHSAGDQENSEQPTIGNRALGPGPPFTFPGAFRVIIAKTHDIQRSCSCAVGPPAVE